MKAIYRSVRLDPMNIFQLTKRKIYRNFAEIQLKQDERKKTWKFMIFQWIKLTSLNQKTKFHKYLCTVNIIQSYIKANWFESKRNSHGHFERTREIQPIVKVLTNLLKSRTISLFPRAKLTWTYTKSCFQPTWIQRSFVYYHKYLN